MANNSKLFTSVCFKWLTERPFKDKMQQSNYFLLLDSEWFLQAKSNDYYNDRYCYTVTLKKRPTTGKSINVGRSCYYYVTTYFETSPSSISYDLAKCRCFHGTDIVLWSFTENELCSKISNFKEKRKWSIVCMFQDIPSHTSIETLRIYNFKKVSTTADKGIQVSQESFDMEKLSDDFSNLFCKPLYPDTKLRCENRIVPVHKSILAARSRVFDAMFQDMTSDVFDVTDLDHRTLDLLLKYAYSGSVSELSDDSVVGLYQAGQKYGMDSLIKACSDRMIAHLATENCVDFLAAANSSNDNLLMEAVSSFLFDHPNIFNSSIWSRFAEQQVSLAYKLTHAYVLRTLKLF